MFAALCTVSIVAIVFGIYCICKASWKRSEILLQALSNMTCARCLREIEKKHRRCPICRKNYHWGKCIRDHRKEHREDPRKPFNFRKFFS